MNDVTVPFVDDIARAIILGIANEANMYNKAWSWWANDATENTAYRYGNVTVILVQKKHNEEYQDSFGGGYGTGDTELVFQFSVEGDDDDGQVVFYRVQGEYSSYGGDSWSENSFREVKPTTRVYREFV